MLSKKSFYMTTMIVGAFLIAAGFLLKEMIDKSIAGVLFGIGSGLFGMSAANLYMKALEDKNPDIRKKNEIEQSDERNTAIRYRAKAKSADIIQWFIIGIGYITILIDATLWVTLTAVLVFALYHVLNAYFVNKFQKEM